MKKPVVTGLVAIGISASACSGDAGMRAQESAASPQVNTMLAPGPSLAVAPMLYLSIGFDRSFYFVYKGQELAQVKDSLRKQIFEIFTQKVRDVWWQKDMEESHGLAPA